jgi:hypothetical protein
LLLMDERTQWLTHGKISGLAQMWPTFMLLLRMPRLEMLIMHSSRLDRGPRPASGSHGQTLQAR